MFSTALSGSNITSPRLCRGADLSINQAVQKIGRRKNGAFSTPFIRIMPNIPGYQRNMCGHGHFKKRRIALIRQASDMLSDQYMHTAASQIIHNLRQIRGYKVRRKPWPVQNIYVFSKNPVIHGNTQITGTKQIHKAAWRAMGIDHAGNKNIGIHDNDHRRSRRLSSMA